MFIVYIILFILGVYALVFAFHLVVAFFSSFGTTWGTLNGWLYLLILIGVFFLLLFIQDSIAKSIRKKCKLTPLQEEELEEAKAKIEEEKAQHEKIVNEIVKDYRKEIEKPYAPIYKEIKKLEKEKKAYQAKIDESTILHPSDLVYDGYSSDKDFEVAMKVWQLKYYLETNRADNIRQALILYDREQAEIKTQALIRHYEDAKRRSDENFKAEQLRLTKERNASIEKARIEQEESNKKIIRQNEELLEKIKKDY